MNWNYLEHPEQLNDIVTESADNTILIFKHSTRCNISRATLDRLERNWKDAEVPNVKPYFLDLLSHRNISNAIAEQFHVEHESPQVLIIRNGKSVYDNSHYGIDFNEIRKQVNR
ncbi:MAG: bacillithiol system redox-active protein YtxJ [Cyclobacteriaceae bacterium]|nr:MAG: bacillithiol system redox-active protein YtxJ [Cyclobacteriaceae bacterium]